MATANPVKGAIKVLFDSCNEERYFFTTECVDYDAFKSLPDVAEFQGRNYVKTGWNSDIGQAYYKSGIQFAMTGSLASNLPKGK